MDSNADNMVDLIRPASLIQQLKETFDIAANNFRLSSEKLQYFLTHGNEEQQYDAAFALRDTESCTEVFKHANSLVNHLSTLQSGQPLNITPQDESFLAFQQDNSTASSHEIEISLRPGGPTLDISIHDLYVHVMNGQRIQLISSTNRETNFIVKVHFINDVNTVMNRFATQTYQSKKAIEYVDIKSTSALRNIIRIIGIPASTLNPFLQGDSNYTALKKHLYDNNPHFFEEGDIITAYHYQSRDSVTRELKQAYSLKLTISLNSFSKFLAKTEENTRIIFNTTVSYKVYEDVIPSYCQRCLSYDHTPTCSQKKPQCKQCLSQHFINSCLPSSKTHPKCITCHRENLTSGSSHSRDINHPAISSFCPVYRGHRDSKRAHLKAEARRNFLSTTSSASTSSLVTPCLQPTPQPNLNVSTSSLLPEPDAMIH